MSQIATIDQLVTRFWRALDHRKYDQLVAMLSEDCVWIREKPTAGKEEILASLNARPSNMLVRHVITNLVVEEVDGRPVTSYFLTVFGHLCTPDDPSTPDCGSPAFLAEVTMSFQKAGTELLIDRIEPEIVFRRAG